MPKWAVLGIAFPEWADENGRITEATALLNGWYVDAADTEGNRVAGVFTHEFGHAINLSHSQVNGPLVYSSYPYDGYRRYPGVPGCVDPVYASSWYDDSVNRADPAIIETMYPFIDTFGDVGRSRARSRTRTTWRRSRTSTRRRPTSRVAGRSAACCASRTGARSSAASTSSRATSRTRCSTATPIRLQRHGDLARRSQR